MHEFFRPLNSFASNDVNVDFDLLENLFDMLKGMCLMLIGL